MSSIDKKVAAIILLINTSAFAGHPLRSDDAHTIGLRSFQLEILSEICFDNQENFLGIPLSLSYGFSDSFDLVITTPFTKTLSENGFPSLDDISIEGKWNLINYLNHNLTLKAGTNISSYHWDPSQNFKNTDFSFSIINSVSIPGISFHLNTNFGHSSGHDELAEFLYQLSLGTEFRASASTILVCDLGIGRSELLKEKSHCLYFISGLMNEITDGITFDIGLQIGISKPETDFGFLSGFTFII